MPYLFFSTSSGTFSYNTAESSRVQTMKDDLENALLSFDDINKRLYLYTNNEMTSYKLDGSDSTTEVINNVEFFTVDGQNNLIYYHHSLNDRIQVYSYSTQSDLPNSITVSGAKDLGIDKSNG